MRRRKKRGYFLHAFLIFQLVLILFISFALMYVNSLLTTYENAQPERLVEDAVAELAEKAENRTLFPSVDTGKWEEGLDIQGIYAELFSASGTRYTPKAGLHAENELVYVVKTEDGFPLAEVTLEAVGDPVTRLAVFTWQEWKLKSAEAVLDPKSYTLSVPDDFTITVNGVKLTDEDGTVEEDGDILYTMENLYFRPEVEILSEKGEKAQFSIKGDRIIPVFYDYQLTLPAAFSVTLNGSPLPGIGTSKEYSSYYIRVLEKPQVIIQDPYGNSVSYEGGNTLPLTVMTVKATDRHKVTVDGKAVPDGFVTYTDNEEYSSFAEYVKNLPRLAEYSIAVLSDDPDILVTLPDGVSLPVEKGTKLYDLTEPAGAPSIPADIASQVDPLAIAKKWSLFVSKDLPGQNYGLYDIAQYLIPNSYQYKIATNYAFGIDITFTSIHTLKDPPFTDEAVSNFVQITDDCFSVDVTFSKHMVLSNGDLVDTMNERLYFVKYDDPANANDTPAWKLASMKEMSTNAE